MLLCWLSVYRLTFRTDSTAESLKLGIKSDTGLIMFGRMVQHERKTERADNPNHV